MKIHEHQAKDIFKRYGIPVPKGAVAMSAAEARTIAESLGGKAVVKAQVPAGGRGKAGGVKIGNTPEEVEAIAKKLIGSRLVTHQTGPEGVPVERVLVEEVSAIQKELYVSITIDGAVKAPVVIASEAGGMEIEEVAARSPEKILRVVIDPTTGFQPFQGRRLAYGMGLPAQLVRPAADLMSNLYRTFAENDCSLVEVNPLVITGDGKLIALDGKINFDDDALFRHQDLAGLRDTGQEDPLDVEASKFDINYIRLEGDVGCMVNGAGLAMATLDIIKLMGAEPANFLDVGGGASEEQVANAFRLLLSDPKVKRVLVNIFGGILRCDVAARGIVKASKEKGVNVPIVIRMRGTNAEEGQKILGESGLKVALAKDLKEASQKVVEIGNR